MSIGARVTVTGSVTAEAGRLGTSSLIAIGDETGGIAVKLPSRVVGFPLGTLLQVTGTLAAPYGQLELRPGPDGIAGAGTAAPPVPGAVAAAGLDEVDELLLVTTTGTVTTKPKKSSGGDLTIALDRAGGAPIKLLADASSGLTAGSFRIGTTYRVTGVVGQRATKKGALDGYRLCLRDPADLVATSTTTGTGPGGTTVGTTASTSAPPPTRISVALGRVDKTLAIDAVVTAPATLLDGTGRRIVVQDASAAIEVLLPAGSAVPGVGTHIRAEGEVGTAYGAPRLRADVVTDLGTGSVPEPLILRREPRRSEEWRLVTATGRIADVRKLGDRWRAELLVGSTRLVIVGQPGSGIAVTDLVEGRMARITGIARRPYPTASDPRYAITPRTPADLRVLGAAIVKPRGPEGTQAPSDPAVAGTGAGSVDQSAAGTPNADLVDLATLVGRTVRVGGLVLDLQPDGFVLDDGTAEGIVRFRGAALDLLPLLEPDDAVNAIGRVEIQAGGLVLVVTEPGGIVQAGDPIAAGLIASSDGSTAVAAPIAVLSGTSIRSPAPTTQQAGLLDGPTLGAGLAGLGTLIALSLLSLAITVARRTRARRLIEARIAARVVALGASDPPPHGPRSAEREEATFG